MVGSSCGRVIVVFVIGGVVNVVGVREEEGEAEQKRRVKAWEAWKSMVEGMWKMRVVGWVPICRVRRGEVSFLWGGEVRYRLANGLAWNCCKIDGVGEGRREGRFVRVGTHSR